LSVGATQHADVTLTPRGNDQFNFVAITNVGATDICVVFSQGGIATPAVVFPVDGTPTVPNSFLIPHGMTGATILAVPTNGNSCTVSAIGSAAGPSIMYVTPVGDQS
jgi:hypothetical protein